jgi:hypothetical protein
MTEDMGNIVRFRSAAIIEHNRHYDELYRRMMAAIDELVELCGSTPAMLVGGLLAKVIDEASDMAQAIEDANFVLETSACLHLIDGNPSNRDPPLAVALPSEHPP